MGKVKFTPFSSILTGVCQNNRIKKTPHRSRKNDEAFCSLPEKNFIKGCFCVQDSRY